MADSFFCFIILYLMIAANPTSAVQSTVKPKIYLLSGGATNPIAVYQALKPVYLALRSQSANIIMAYQGTGGAEGIKRFSEGIYDFAGSDLEIPESDYGNTTDDIQLFPTMAGPLSLAYNVPEMPTECLDVTSIQNNGNCLNLTKELIVGIFNGTINRWSDPLLVQYNRALRSVNNTINVIVRSDHSGITNILTSYLAAVDVNWKATFSSFPDGCDLDGLPIKWSSNVTIRCGAKGQGISGIISNLKYSIGYLASSDARDNLLPEARIQNKANQWVTASVMGTQAAMDSTVDNIDRRLTASLVDPPSREAYPISGYSYLLIRKKSMQNCTTAMELYRYFQYLLEDPLARDIMKDFTKAPLSEKILSKIHLQVFRQMECKGEKLDAMVELAISIENGSHDAWKVPVAIVFALIGVICFMSLGSYAYFTYTKHKHVLTNTFIIHLETPHELQFGHKASSHSINSTGQRSAAETVDTLADYPHGLSVLRLAGGEICLLQALCPHLSGETLLWKSRILLVQMKDQMTHINILKFMGISFRDSVWTLVTACPSKGCLQDILQIDKYQLDNVFRYSIATDIIEGMNFLHRLNFVHGQLTPTNCYVDYKWNAVVGDWGENSLHATQKVAFVAFEPLYRAARDKENNRLNDYYRSLFWSAPETLHRDNLDYMISSSHDFQSDIYSCGIVLYEIFTNLLPYENLIEERNQWRPQEVLLAVQKDNIRPSIPDEAIAKYRKIVEVLQSMWRPEKTARPSFLELKKTMKKINVHKRNIIDTMMEAVESYAHSLEEKVAERTGELEKLTKNMEALLHSMMPSSIANKLFRGEHVEPEYYESVTLCFTDVVGFTSIAAMSLPADLVTMLNDLYTVFDLVLNQHDIYKVETIGDSYMCVSGLPHRNGISHSQEIGDMAMEMLHAVSTVPIRHMPNRPLMVRVGAHSGSVMAGVVGIKMPRYCIFGDTVNTAARMESSSLPMRIQISEATKTLLEGSAAYEIVLRGERGIKGKGMMTTYWLTGKKGFDKSLPPFDANDDDALMKLLDESQIK